MVMQRLNSRQYGGASGSDYFGVGGRVGAGISGGPSIDLSAQAGSGDQRWTGIIVLVALALTLIGYHGLKGG